MARNFDNERDNNEEEEEEINYRYDSQVTTPRSEGFDYPTGARAKNDETANGRISPGSSDYEGSPDERSMDEAHREVEGSRESLTERFKRYIRRILPLGNGRGSPPRVELRVRKEFRVPLDRYGRHSRRGSSSSDNCEFDEHYDSHEPSAEARAQDGHSHGHHHQHQQLPDESQYNVDTDYEEDEIYDPSPVSTSSSLHSGHVHHGHARSGIVQEGRAPQVAYSDSESDLDEEDGEEGEEGEEGEGQGEIEGNEAELTDGPLGSRSRSSSRSGGGGGGGSSSSGRSLASSRRSGARSATRSRSSSGGRGATSRSRSRTRTRSRSSSRGSRRSSAGSRRSAQNRRQSRARRRT